VIIGWFVSLPGPRLAATLGVLWVVLAAGSVVRAGALPDSTWVALAPLPQQGGTAIFGLAVDPSNNQALIAANSAGTLLRSVDGGSSWAAVYHAKVQITTIAFNPLKAGQVLAGTQGAGALVSGDGGATWGPVTGLDGRTVRVFGFALTLLAAGTDHGVYTSPDGSAWRQAGLAASSIDALAVEAIHDPVHLVAASDSQTSGAALSLAQSPDAGVTWNATSPPISGAFVIKLVAGPLPPTGDTRPLLAGTTAGLFLSADNGTTFTPLSGGELLPSTDFTQVAFVTDHYDRFYVASDGGGSGSGGLWKTADGGATFLSMNPPVQSVTALAVSNDEEPILYAAMFQPADHSAELWALHDTGGLPLSPIEVTPSVSAARTAGTTSSSGLLDFARSPQAPYLLLGAVALILLLAAGVAHLRSRHR